MFDIKVVIKITLEMIQGFAILLILCINFISLYNYLVKLSVILIKRLMVNLMSLCQLYEQRKIDIIK